MKTESKTIDLKSIIGFFPLCNACTVLVHQIDYGDEKVLASMNGIEPEWCGLTEEYSEETQEMELGFSLGSLFVPFHEVMRFWGGCE